MLLTRQEGSIMSISWVHFWPQGILDARRCKTNCPRDQLGTFLATGPS